MSPLFVLIVGTTFPCDVQPEQARVRIGLYAEFQQPPPPAVRRAIEEELAATVIPAGLLVEWRPLGDPGPEQWRAGIATIRFRGRCDASPRLAFPGQRRVFGETHVEQGAVIPYGTIYCEAIRAALAKDLAALRPGGRTVVWARAAARVLAHELYHILAKTRLHGADGIGKRDFTARELAADDFRFEDREIQQLRRAFSLVSADKEDPCRGE